MGPNNQPSMNPTPSVAHSPWPRTTSLRCYPQHSALPAAAMAVRQSLGCLGRFSDSLLPYHKRATQVGPIGRRENRQREGESTSCGFRRHSPAGAGICINGGRCLYGYPSRDHDGFQKGQFSHSIARRSRSFRKLQFYPHVGHHASPVSHFTTSYPPSGSGSEHAKTDRVILISFLWYIKKFIPFEPTSSFLVVLIFTCPQHRLSRIKSS